MVAFCRGTNFRLGAEYFADFFQSLHLRKTSYVSEANVAPIAISAFIEIKDLALLSNLPLHLSGWQ